MDRSLGKQSKRDSAVIAYLGKFRQEACPSQLRRRLISRENRSDFCRKFSVITVASSSKFTETAEICHLLLDNVPSHHTACLLGKKLIILYWPFFRSLNAGVITWQGKVLACEALKYSLEAKLISKGSSCSASNFLSCLAILSFQKS